MDGLSWCSVVNETRMNILAYINLSTSSLSMIGAGSIIVYTILKRVCRSPEIRPLFYLSLADLLLSLFWCITTAYYLTEHTSKDKKKHVSHVCFYLELVTELFHIITFFLTVNYAIHVYIKVKERTHHLSNLIFTTVSTDRFYQRLFFILLSCCWIVPLLLEIPFLIGVTRKSGNDTSCNTQCSRCQLLFDRPKVCMSGRLMYSSSYLMVTTLSLSIIVMMVLYCLTWLHFRSSVMRMAIITRSQHVQVREMRSRISWFIAAFLICWLPALAVVILSIKLENDHNSETNMDLRKNTYFAMYILQSLTAPMQGFLNSLVYGWTRKNFHVTIESNQHEIQYGGLVDNDVDSLQSSYSSVNN